MIFLHIILIKGSHEYFPIEISPTETIPPVSVFIACLILASVVLEHLPVKALYTVLRLSPALRAISVIVTGNLTMFIQIQTYVDKYSNASAFKLIKTRFGEFTRNADPTVTKGKLTAANFPIDVKNVQNIRCIQRNGTLTIAMNRPENTNPAKLKQLCDELSSWTIQDLIPDGIILKSGLRILIGDYADKNCNIFEKHEKHYWHI